MRPSDVPLPRAESLRFIQEVDVQWQKIYREPEEADAANHDMINEATKKAEAEREAHKKSESELEHKSTR